MQYASKLPRGSNRVRRLNVRSAVAQPCTATNGGLDSRGPVNSAAPTGLLAVREVGRRSIFVPADSNHQIARERSQGKPVRTDGLPRRGALGFRTVFVIDAPGSFLLVRCRHQLPFIDPGVAPRARSHPLLEKSTNDQAHRIAHSRCSRLP